MRDAVVVPRVRGTANIPERNLFETTYDKTVSLDGQEGVHHQDIVIVLPTKSEIKDGPEIIPRNRRPDTRHTEIATSTLAPDKTNLVYRVE